MKLLYICNLCTIKYDYVLKIITYKENNKCWNEFYTDNYYKNNFYELVYFIIKIIYKNIYINNFFNIFCSIMDNIFKEHKTLNMKLLSLFLFSNKYFKYEEFYHFFNNKMKKDDRVFKKNISYEKCMFYA